MHSHLEHRVFRHILTTFALVNVLQRRAADIAAQTDENHSLPSDPTKPPQAHAVATYGTVPNRAGPLESPGAGKR